MSERFFRRSGYVWTGCGAGWFVLAIVAQSWAAAAVCIGCLAMAGLHIILSEAL